jgi:hypothetical protein
LESETINSVIPRIFLESQEHILHSAASILRHDIQSFFINNEDYPNANEVSLAISIEKMPQSLAIWDINALFDAFFLFQSNTCNEPSHL